MVVVDAVQTTTLCQVYLWKSQPNEHIQQRNKKQEKVYKNVNELVGSLCPKYEAAYSSRVKF